MSGSMLIAIMMDAMPKQEEGKALPWIRFGNCMVTRSGSKGIKNL